VKSQSTPPSGRAIKLSRLFATKSFTFRIRSLLPSTTSRYAKIDDTLCHIFGLKLPAAGGGILDFGFWINRMTKVERPKSSFKSARHANPKSEI
jgi:hypothetical protein